jgi:hypothetical protein
VKTGRYEPAVLASTVHV